MKRGLMVGAAAVAVLLVVMARLAGGQARVAEVATVPAEAVNVHAAVLEVARPEGVTEDAVWQREIATYAARIRLGRTVEALRLKLVEEKTARAGAEADGRKEKIRPVLLNSAEAFAEAVHVRQLPGTALLEVWADVSNDAATSAGVTGELVGMFLAQVKDDAAIVQADVWQHTRASLDQLEEQAKISKSRLDDYRSTRETDVPLPATAAPRAQVDRAVALREVKDQEERLAALRVQIIDLRRRMMELQAAGDRPPGIRVVQAAK